MTTRVRQRRARCQRSGPSNTCCRVTFTSSRLCAITPASRRNKYTGGNNGRDQPRGTRGVITIRSWHRCKNSRRGHHLNRGRLSLGTCCLSPIRVLNRVTSAKGLIIRRFHWFTRSNELTRGRRIITERSCDITTCRVSLTITSSTSSIRVIKRIRITRANFNCIITTFCRGLGRLNFKVNRTLRVINILIRYLLMSIQYNS